MTRRVRVIRGEYHPEDDRLGAVLETPFHADFVAELKAAVPWQDRAWNPEEKTWWVCETWAEDAEDLVVHHFGETLIVEEDGGEEEYRGPAGVTARQEKLF